MTDTPHVRVMHIHIKGGQPAVIIQLPAPAAIITDPAELRQIAAQLLNAADQLDDPSPG